MKYKHIEDYIGNTPLVKLRRLGSGKNTLLVKLEGNNPGGSVKDRPAFNMIRRAEEEGRIRPGDHLIEATSGNTGMAVAFLAALKGYRAVLVMSEIQSQERRQILTAFGAELVLTPGAEGMTGAIRKAEEIAASDERYFIPQQFKNEKSLITSNS